MSTNSVSFKFDIKPNKPLLIAGPCSAETEEQVIQLAQAIQSTCPQVSLLRAGIWKPRTRPNSFEGIGEKGLVWLKKASRITKIPVCTEVAKASHVEAALKAEIDVLWIGARSTVSPFIMQEIADALRGVDIPVMIKNPINPDLALWLGGIERIQQAGIKEIAAIHRGFSSYNTSKYRNVPNWEIPIELKRQAPNPPLICDPSHIGGRRELVGPLAQQAVNLQFDGLMIETHLEPDKAWSDAEQQITPDALAHLIASLSTSLKEASQEDVYPHLDTYRQEIDRLDNYILELLAERMNIAQQIGNYKKQESIAIHQPKRWAETVKRALELGETNGLSKSFILELFQKIHNESIERQAKN